MNVVTAPTGLVREVRSLPRRQSAGPPKTEKYVSAGNCGQSKIGSQGLGTVEPLPVPVP